MLPALVSLSLLVAPAAAGDDPTVDPGVRASPVEVLLFEGDRGELVVALPQGDWTCDWNLAVWDMAVDEQLSLLQEGFGTVTVEAARLGAALREADCRAR